MDFLHPTLPTIAENVALDEALFRIAETDPQRPEVLRIWQAPEPAVVVGRGSRVADEVQLDQCDRLGIPVLRRVSGGAAIVADRGCLMYSLILSYARHPQLQLIDVAHSFVLDRMAEHLAPIDASVARAGTSDLAVCGCRSENPAGRPNLPGHATARWRKFSGNSMRRGRHHLLYHGTLLFDVDLELMTRCLKTAPRQPEYRSGRAHRDFVTSLSTTADELQAAILSAWLPERKTTAWPQALVAELVEQKYGRDGWNRRR